MGVATEPRMLLSTVWVFVRSLSTCGGAVPLPAAHALFSICWFPSHTTLVLAVLHMGALHEPGPPFSIMSVRAAPVQEVLQLGHRCHVNGWQGPGFCKLQQHKSTSLHLLGSASSSSASPASSPSQGPSLPHPTTDNANSSLCKSHSHFRKQKSNAWFIGRSWPERVGASGQNWEAHRSTLVQGTFFHWWISVLPGSALERIRCAATSKVAFITVLFV